MKRREWFGRAGIGVAALSLPAIVKRLVTPVEAQGKGNGNGNGSDHNTHHGPSLSGPLALAVMNFGQWDHNLDRQLLTNPLLPSGGPNQHFVLPFEVTIKSGGAVVFAVSGNHQIIVYDNDVTKVDDFNASHVTPPPHRLIEYVPGRLYRGPAPANFGSPTAGFQQDRIESVHFPNPGTFLVICGRSVHLLVAEDAPKPPMHGYVRVLP